MAVAEQVYRYLAPSEVRTLGGRTDVVLASSGGNVEGQPADHPRFFDGFLKHPEQTAVALLTCARVARTRYYTPPGMVAAIRRSADPVVTSERAQLRFESFSACCGAYARVDVLADGLDRAPVAIGTTNVDFNPPMREALARVTGSQPVRLQVGADEVGVRTFGRQAIEQKVPLSERWVRGFAEVQVAAGELRLLADLTMAEAGGFLRSLPRSSRHVVWAHPAGRSLRLSSRPAPGAACLAAPERPRCGGGGRHPGRRRSGCRRHQPSRHAWRIPNGVGGEPSVLRSPGELFSSVIGGWPSRGRSLPSSAHLT